KVQDRTLRAGQKVVGKGKVRPATRGLKVRLQRKSNGRWHTVAKSRTKASGAYTLKKKVKAGTWKVRVYVQPGKGLMGTTSKAIRKIKVKKVVPPKPVKDDVNNGGGGTGPVWRPPAPIVRPAPPPRRSP